MDIQDVEIGRARSEAPRHDLPPPADAPYERRAAWSEDYVTWLLAEAPQQGVTPTDVRATHRYEIEFNCCVVDPEAYVRAVAAELRRVH